MAHWPQVTVCLSAHPTLCSNACTSLHNTPSQNKDIYIYIHIFFPLFDSSSHLFVWWSVFHSHRLRQKLIPNWQTASRCQLFNTNLHDSSSPQQLRRVSQPSSLQKVHRMELTCSKLKKLYQPHSVMPGGQCFNFREEQCESQHFFRSVKRWVMVDLGSII